MGIFNEQSSTSSHISNGKSLWGPAGIGFVLTQVGNYDIQNKKLVNVKQGTDPNDVINKQYVDSKTSCLDDTTSIHYQ